MKCLKAHLSGQTDCTKCPLCPQVINTFQRMYFFYELYIHENSFIIWKCHHPVVLTSIKFEKKNIPAMILINL